ncbi:DUF3108 domain-containing protein [Geobacter anodireducens]|uniref:DUF3108 domain-containing protein n=1 Tax=Geobacter anodireducens TaxID=1340425 RepID=A0ABR9NUV4_9BACT|nr:DUF3108 domain-containing protein [Geobacter anodireducens]
MDLPVTSYRFAVFVVLSGLVHVAGLCVLTSGGILDLGAPVLPMAAVSISLRDPETSVPSLPEGQSSRESVGAGEQERPGERSVVAAPERADQPTALPVVREATPATEPLPPEAVAVAAPVPAASTEVVAEADPAARSPHPEVMPPLRKADEFLAAGREKLTYRITMLGIPVGEAMIEAVREREREEVTITTRVRSYPVISAVYPVDDVIETRLVAGNYLITRIRQREGAFTGDSGFTLMMREKKAFWADRLRNRYATHLLPREDVTDIVSGFYFLRNKRLEVGQPVVLHLFDSNEYAPTTVEVLRREGVTLPGGRTVDTLVVHPLLKTAGIFRRTGDIMIWVTDDAYRVPVRMETAISLGRVRAELVAAESEQ